MTRWSATLCLAAAALLALIGIASPRPVHAQASGAPDPFGRSFYADHSALRPGDILTVLIEEESSATESAQTSTSKSDGISAAFSTPTRTQRQWQGTLGDQFSGGGQVARSGELLGQLSVVVDRIDPNGNLWVRGEQDIKVNGERQRILLTGRVRPVDIDADNTVPSWRVGDARISLLGKGVLGGSQSPGIISRILHFLHLD